MFTRSAQVYNSQVGALELGFADFVGYVKVTNVNEDSKGKKARRGAQMYDYDHSVMLTLNQEELAMLSASVEDLIAGGLDMIEFSHKSGNSIKSVSFGIGLDGESKEFQVCMTELERDDPDPENPIEQSWYEVPVETLGSEGNEREYRPALEIFRSWIRSALAVSLMGVAHSTNCSLPERGRSGRGPGGGDREDDRSGGDRGGNREDDRGGGDRGGSRTADRSSRPRRPAPRRDEGDGGNDNRGNDNDGRGKDDIPF